MVTTEQSIHQIGEESISAKTTSWRAQIIHRLVRNPSAMAGFFFLLLVIVLAILAPWIAHYNPDAVNITDLNQDPSSTHWFGTDYLGRDMWSRVVWGGRISLPAGIGVNLISFGIGVPLGLIAGYAGRAADEIIMRIMDVLLSFPAILLAIGVVAILGPGIISAIIAVGIVSIPGFARIARGSTLRARENDFVQASRAVGAGHLRVLLRHILPNVVDPLIVLATLNLGYAILVTAALSFLGLGTQLPTSDWGTMLSQGYEHMFESWSEVTFPGIAIMVAVLGINLLGDGLADALNPRLRSDS